MGANKPSLKQIPSPRESSELNKDKESATLGIISRIMEDDLGDVYVQEWLVKNLCQTFSVQACILLLHNMENDQVILKSSANTAVQYFYDLELDWDQPPVNLIQKGDQPNTSSESLTRKFAPEIEVDSFLWSSLDVHEQLLGAVIIVNTAQGYFSPQDQELLDRIATAISHTIYNERLIQQLKVANADLEVSHWQLLRSRNTLRTLFDSIPASIYIIDKKYNLAAINMHRSNRINTPPNRLVGHRCYEALFGREDVCDNCRVIDTIFDSQNTVRTKREWLSDHDPLEWEISTYPIHDDAGQVVQAIILEQDVTEKRRLETTLAQSEKLAAVGQLAAGLAHEINNPLTAIIANAQLLQRELDPDDENLELVDLIGRAGNRASQVVRNLLDMARKEEYDFAPTDINQTIRNALELLQHEFLKRSAVLINDLAESLPKIKASQDHLQGVWLNLISNALDALGSEKKEIRIATFQQGNDLRVIVTDSGKGIPPKHLSHIFEPFYTTKAPGRGTGLGLSVVHRIIKQHGGRILVDSQPDLGTQFTVILPIS